MSSSDSPFKRSIGVSGVVRWLIAIAAVIAIGGAVAAGRTTMAISLIVFLFVALVAWYWVLLRKARM
jgi:hypothetical protein